MLRRLGTLGLGIVMKGSDKVASRVQRVSKYARHPRTEITALVGRIMEAGESEVSKLESVLRQRIDERAAPAPAARDQSNSRLRVSNVLQTVKIGDVIGFTDVKTGARLRGIVKLNDLDNSHRFLLVQAVGEITEAGKYYLCRCENGTFVGEDEI